MLYEMNSGAPEVLTQAQIDSERGLPPFMVRRKKEVAQNLGEKPLGDSQTSALAIKTFIDSVWQDDLGWKSCPYVYKVNELRNHNETSFNDTLYTISQLAQPFAENFNGVFNITAEEFGAMPFRTQERYSDITFAEVFEGYAQPHNWTTDEWKMIIAQLDASLLDVESDHSRYLDISHQIRTPLREINSLVAGKTEDIPKYRLYSAHDSNIANWLKQLNPSFEWHGIPYAANFYFELYRKYGQYFVRTMYNGSPLSLGGCGEYCPIDGFNTYIKSVIQTDDSALYTACMEEPQVQRRQALFRSIKRRLSSKDKFLN